MNPTFQPQPSIRMVKNAPVEMMAELDAKLLVSNEIVKITIIYKEMNSFLLIQ